MIRALNRNTRLLLPGEVTFTIIKPFVREACKLAWEMSALANPLDVAVASDSELFDDSRCVRVTRARARASLGCWFTMCIDNSHTRDIVS